jgi:hypothetical protein
MAKEVVRMRFVRDSMVGSTGAGRILVDAFNAFYYSWSPAVAQIIAPNWILRWASRMILLPLVWIVEVTAQSFAIVKVVTGSGDAASIVAFLLAALMSMFCYILLPMLIVVRLVRRIAGLQRINVRESFA